MGCADSESEVSEEAELELLSGICVSVVCLLCSFTFGTVVTIAVGRPRATTPEVGRSESESPVVCAAERVCSELEDAGFEAIAGTAPGHILHCASKGFQYTSRRMRRYPVASRLDRHFRIALSSYRSSAKQTDFRVTVGWVTKLMGMRDDKSRCDCALLVQF